MQLSFPACCCNTPQSAAAADGAPAQALLDPPRVLPTEEGSCL
jgi:hypothetical protein